MRIMITRGGIFRNGTDMLPVGTELDVPDDFNKWGGKWEPVEPTQGKLEVATPETKDDAPAMDEELQAARNEYERTFGEKPHARMKAETIRARLADAESEE